MRTFALLIYEATALIAVVSITKHPLAYESTDTSYAETYRADAIRQPSLALAGSARDDIYGVSL